MAEAYVAARRLKIGDSFREPGEPVPEAVNWRNLREHLDLGNLTMVSDKTSNGFPETHGFNVDPSGVLVDREEYDRLMAYAVEHGYEIPVPHAQRVDTPPPDAPPDPAQMTIEQVLTHIEEFPDDVIALLDAEQKGKARKTLMQAITDILEAATSNQDDQGDKEGQKEEATSGEG